MPSAIEEYEKLAGRLTGQEGDVAVGQMFGKSCLKVGGKAFMAQHLETVVFKLNEPHHTKAITLPGAKLWDPSGKGRPMKEWVALPPKEHANFLSLAAAALSYVSGGCNLCAMKRNYENND